MDPRYSRIEPPSSQPRPQSTASSVMTILTSQPWTLTRNTEHSQDWEMFQPRSDPEGQPIQLPPLKQVFPDFDLSPRGNDDRSQYFGSGDFRFRSPDFNASPHKRRRYEDEAEAEAAHQRHVPRVHRNPRHRVPISPRQSPSAPRTSERWPPAPEPTASRSSERWPPAHETTVSPGSSYSLPTPMGVQDLSRPHMPLPSLRTTMNFENESRNSLDSSRSSSREYPRTYSQDYTHYSTHNHYQSQPPSPNRPYDRAPYSAGVYPHYMEPTHTSHYGELGAMAGESKQRKRRGNLPKETTDKLRSWFLAHLTHPYPTEDEKQELVRQTGLQMNQISNWFINARRRQLPTMLKNEADAAGRGIASREGKSTDPSSVASSPMSEVAHSSDEILQRHQGGGSLKRGSV